MQHYEETIANPFTLTAKRLQDFLANYVPVPAADPPAGPSVQHPRPPARERDGQEVYSFGSTRNQDTQERDTAPIAAVDPRTRSRLRPLQSPSRPTVNVIDLTVVSCN